MKNAKVLKIYLVIAGLLLMVIGGSTLLMPVVMKATAGIQLEGDINSLNDVRAASALFFSIGLITALGAFIERLTFTSTLISFLSFLALGIGRASSILLDGMPSDGLTKATGLEFVLGIAGVIIFSFYKEKSSDIQFASNRR